MQLKNLTELPRETKVEFSYRVDKIAYRSGSAFRLKDKIPRFVFGLPSAILTIVAHRTEELDGKRKSFKICIQIERKEREAYRVCLNKVAANREDFYVSPQSDQVKIDHMILMYGTRHHDAYRGPQEQAML